MPVVITHRPSENIILVRPSGIYTATESLAAWQRFCDLHDLPTGQHVIVDHRFVEDYEIDFNQMQTIAALLENLIWKSGTATRMAHFCPFDLGFGMARMFEQITTARSPFPVAVFRDPVEMVDWLGLSRDTLIQLADDADLLKQPV